MNCLSHSHVIYERSQGLPPQRCARIGLNDYEPFLQKTSRRRAPSFGALRSHTGSSTQRAPLGVDLCGASIHDYYTFGQRHRQRAFWRPTG